MPVLTVAWPVIATVKIHGWTATHLSASTSATKRMTDGSMMTNSAALTDDQAQLAHERQRLSDAQTKLAEARDEDTRLYYRLAVAGWKRSIGVLEREINERRRMAADDRRST